MSSSLFARKSRRQAMLEAIMIAEVTLSMMKVTGISLIETDGGFMSSLWDIYCRPVASSGKVRIFWVAVVDSGNGNMAAKEMDERFCSDSDPAQIAEQFISLMTSVIARFARQRTVDVFAAAAKICGPKELTLDLVHQVNEAMPGPR